jgi:hypothetical protein
MIWDLVSEECQCMYHTSYPANQRIPALSRRCSQSPSTLGVNLRLSSCRWGRMGSSGCGI